MHQPYGLKITELFESHPPQCIETLPWRSSLWTTSFITILSGDAGAVWVSQISRNSVLIMSADDSPWPASVFAPDAHSRPRWRAGVTPADRCQLYLYCASGKATVCVSHCFAATIWETTEQDAATPQLSEAPEVVNTSWAVQLPDGRPARVASCRSCLAWGMVLAEETKTTHSCVECVGRGYVVHEMGTDSIGGLAKVAAGRTPLIHGASDAH